MSLESQAIILAGGVGSETVYFIADLTTPFTNGDKPRFNGVAFATDGDVVAVGFYDRENLATRHSGIIAGFDLATGENQWQRSAGGGSDTRVTSFRDCVVHPNGNVFVAGQNYGGAATHSFNTYWMGRYPQAGGSAFIRQGTCNTGGPNEVDFNAVCLDSGTNVFFAGNIFDPNRPGLRKTDSNFNDVWSANFNGDTSFAAEGTGCVVDPTDTYAWFAGMVEAGTPLVRRACFARVRLSDGNLFQRKYFANWNNDGNVLTGRICWKHDDDTMVFCGRSSLGAGDLSGMIWELDDTGSTGANNRSLGLVATDTRFTQVCTDQNSNIYVAGITDVSGIIAKYDTNYTLQWQRTFKHSGGITTIEGIEHDQNNRIAICAHNNSNKLIVAALPDDGSLTGVYGSYTYAVSSLVGGNEANPGSASISSVSLTHTDPFPSMPVTTPTLVDAVEIL